MWVVLDLHGLLHNALWVCSPIAIHKSGNFLFSTYNSEPFGRGCIELFAVLVITAIITISLRLITEESSMKIITRTLALLLLFTPLTLVAQTSEEDQLTKEAVKANKKLIVARNMKLTEQEKKKFWPVYETYQEALRKVDEKAVKLIEDYAKHYESLSGDKASSLLKQYFAVEEERLQLQQSYVSKFEKAIPPQKVVRYYQIENKLDAIIEYELVEIIPLAK